MKTKVRVGNEWVEYDLTELLAPYIREVMERLQVDSPEGPRETSITPEGPREGDRIH